MVSLCVLNPHYTQHSAFALSKLSYLLLQTNIILTFVSGLECFEGMYVDLIASIIIVLYHRTYSRYQPFTHLQQE